MGRRTIAEITGTNTPPKPFKAKIGTHYRKIIWIAQNRRVYVAPLLEDKHLVSTYLFLARRAKSYLDGTFMKSSTDKFKYHYNKKDHVWIRGEQFNKAYLNGMTSDQLADLIFPIRKTLYLEICKRNLKSYLHLGYRGRDFQK